ncbi:MAG: hypothetical protein U0401_02725 [Anaerolineae bacterium]
MMSEVSASEMTVTVSLAELETLIRRVVRQELIRLLHQSSSAILEDGSHKEPDEPAGDEALLAEALAVLKQYENDPNSWTSWEEFKREKYGE